MNTKNYDNHSYQNKKRFGYVMILVSFILFVFVIFRLGKIMVGGHVDGQNLDARVSSLYQSNDVLLAERGTIFDKNNNPIAVDSTSYKMFAILTDEWSPESRPIHVQEPEAVARILSQHLTISYESALEKLTADASQVEFGSIGNNLSFDTVHQLKSELEEQELTGITFEESQTRLYPNGTFASHIVGLAQDTSKDDEPKNPNQQISGVMGLEAQFDEALTGNNGMVNFQKDRFGYMLPNQTVHAQESVDGADLHLTLDRRLQVYLENIMTQVQEEFTPKAMTATVMDAKNGEIIASAQRPTFNAMTKEGIDQSWQNLLVDYEIEPGSTLKVITLAAAIEEGVFDPNAYYQSGTYPVAGGKVRDVKPEGWGTISYLEGVFRSSNVSFVKLVEAMGFDTWKSYLDAFGFGQETGIELPSEQSGKNPYQWDLQKVNTAFGQGITVTPVQMLQAFTAITNEGQMVQPSIVKGLDQSDESSEGEPADGSTEAEVTETASDEVNTDSKVVASPISKETAEKTLQYLQMGVESDVGTARGYRIEGVPVAAKTGTAQIVNPETGQYYSSESDFIFSVASMLPADDPEYIIYITVQQPELDGKVGHGSAVVNRIFQPLSQRLLVQDGYNIDEPDSINFDIMEMPQVIEQDTQNVISELEAKGLTFSVVGNGDKIVQQYPYRGSQIYKGQRAILLTNGAMSMPDLTGWSRSDLAKLSDLTGLTFNITGEGYVVSQSITPQSFVETGDQVSVTLSDPHGTSGEEGLDVIDHPDQLWDESTFEE